MRGIERFYLGSGDVDLVPIRRVMQCGTDADDDSSFSWSLPLASLLQVIQGRMGHCKGAHSVDVHHCTITANQNISFARSRTKTKLRLVELNPACPSKTWERDFKPL